MSSSEVTQSWVEVSVVIGVSEVSQTWAEVSAVIGKAEVSQSWAEVSAVIGRAEVTQSWVEASLQTIAASLITQHYMEVSSVLGERIRLSQHWTEISSQLVEGLIVSQLWIEVSRDETEEPPVEPPVATDTIMSVVYPVSRQDGDPPTWVAQRGQDCRAFDVTQNRMVWGSSHSFIQPDDVVIDNGMIRGRFGTRDEIANMDVWAFKANDWRYMGHIYFADPASTTELMQRVRIARMTADQLTVAIELRDGGPVHLMMKRGERAFRILHGSQIEPQDSRTRRVLWDTANDGAGVADGRIVSPFTVDGLSQCVCVLRSGYTATPGSTTGLMKTTSLGEFMALVRVSGGASDGALDYQRQFAGEFEQELRIR